MLFQLLDKVTRGISSLDPERETPQMLKQLKAAIPEVFAQMDRNAGSRKEALRVVETGIASFALSHIREIPEIVGEMLKGIRGRSTDPAVACVMTATLGYLVQPHDIIPDTAPGGFGFVDDYILLRAGQLEYLSARSIPHGQIQEIGQKLSTVASFVPTQLKPLAQSAVDGLSALIQFLQVLPTEMQVMTTQMIIANPLQAAMPQAPPGFSPHPGFPVSGLSPGLVWEGRNTWQDGDRLGVSFPGGGGVVSDGRDIFTY